MLNQVLSWIKEQKHYIKIQLDLQIDGTYIKKDDINELVISNSIIQLRLKGFIQELSKNVYEKIKYV